MVRRILAVTPVLAGAVVLLVLSAVPPAVTAQGTTELDGRALFEREKCGMCHGIAPLRIEATVKVASMRGPDLSEIEARDSGLLVGYLRQKTEIDGAKHKKAFSGSDEELGALVSWLEGLAEGDDD